MHKVGIFGLWPEDFKDLEQARRKIVYCLDLITHQYENVIFNLAGEPGTDFMAMNYCINNSLKYHLFLPYDCFTMIDYIKDGKLSVELSEYFNHASSITTCISANNLQARNEVKRDEQIICSSNFLIAFGDRRKQGRVYRMIKLAHSHDKMVFDGMNKLKIIAKRKEK